LHNKKLYLAYGMVLCLVTLTDRQTRRAGLSASAELLVKQWEQHSHVFVLEMTTDEWQMTLML